MKTLSRLAILALLLCGRGAVAAEPTSLEDFRKLLDALQAAGCSAVSEISAESYGYDVEGVVCADGKYRELRLDKSFRITGKK